MSEVYLGVMDRVIAASSVDRAFDSNQEPGADTGFQVRGAHLKNCAERREARKFLGYFV